MTKFHKSTLMILISMFSISVFGILAPKRLFPEPAIIYGGSSSGGGFIIGDKRNPWFLHNTGVVRYCIDLDRENFSAPLSLVKEKILEAFFYWKSAFAQRNKNEYFKIATQNFMEVNCSDYPAPDIFFQMGRLSEDQKRLLGNTNELVGITKRTSYDSAKMKGRGFVYVAPESGSNHPGVKFGSLLRWSTNEGIALKIILIHELGHVFGLKHFNHIVPMQEDLPQWLAMLPGEENSSLGPGLESLLNSSKFHWATKGQSVICSKSSPTLHKTIARLFVGPKEGCIKINFAKPTTIRQPIDNAATHIIEVLHSDKSHGDYNKLGTMISTYHDKSSYYNLISIYVLKNRQVFFDIPNGDLQEDYYRGFWTDVKDFVFGKYVSNEGSRVFMVHWDNTWPLLSIGTTEDNDFNPSAATIVIEPNWPSSTAQRAGVNWLRR